LVFYSYFYTLFCILGGCWNDSESHSWSNIVEIDWLLLFTRDFQTSLYSIREFFIYLFYFYIYFINLFIIVIVAHPSSDWRCCSKLFLFNKTRRQTKLCCYLQSESLCNGFITIIQNSKSIFYTNIYVTMSCHLICDSNNRPINRLHHSCSVLLFILR